MAGSTEKEKSGGEGKVLSIDALEELKAASKAAAEKSAEVELQTQESKQALTLAAFPVQQTQTLPTRLGVRIRQAKWTIRIEPPEGFTVAPERAQIVAGREVVSWSLMAEDEPDFSTRIILQTQLISPRSPKLRWRILAVSSELPQLTLPVEGKLLSNLQNMATVLNQRLQLAIDQLAAIAKTPGIQSAAKSEVYRQRDNYRSQLQSMEVVKEVIAEANQLEGWSDGQFTLHARLHDSNASKEALVEFGQVELPEDQRQENEPEANDAAIQ